MAGVLLAAGAGSRLGTPKALVEVAGTRLADWCVGMLRAGGADPVLVVSGAVGLEIEGVTVVHNPRWRTGMGSSLAAGLAAVPSDCTAAVIALVDQPLVGELSVARLIAAHRAGAAIAVATYHGSPRNPVLVARAHWPGVLHLATGDVGARPYLRSHPDLVTSVECGDVGTADDVDSPDDLAELRERLAHPGSGRTPGS